MVIAITILTTIVVVIAIALAATILHMFEIQKELQSLKRDIENHDRMFDNASNYLRDLALAIKDIQDYLLKKENESPEYKKLKNKFNGPGGEA